MTMAKRTKKEVKKEFKRVATPEKTKPEGGNGKDLSHPSVNPSYDAMPDEINDPGAVYRMAYLDQKQSRLQTQIQLAEKEFAERMVNLQRQKVNTITSIQAELQDTVRTLKDHRDHMEEQYGISLRSYSYNDETGVLTKQVLLDMEADAQKSKSKEQSGGSPTQ